MVDVRMCQKHRVYLARIKNKAILDGRCLFVSALTHAAVDEDLPALRF